MICSFLVKYNWHTISYYTQVYNIVILYFYTLWNDPQDKLSYIVIYKFLTVEEIAPVYLIPHL